MATLRRANRSDAKRLAEFAERTFRDTFGWTTTPENVDLHCVATYSESIQSAEISDSSTVVLLSEQGDRLIGFAQLHWGDAPDCVVAKSPGEILRLYVDNDFKGKGIAHDLMNAALEEMKARGSDVVWLGVWEQNTRAMAFYRKFGFLVVGDHIYQVGGDPQVDLIVARSMI